MKKDYEGLGIPSNPKPKIKLTLLALVLVCSVCYGQKIGSIRYSPVTYRVLEEATDGGLPYSTDSLIAGFNKQEYKHWFTGDEWITIAYLDSMYKPMPKNRQWWFCWPRFDKRIKSDTVFGKLTMVVFRPTGDSLRDKNVYMITQLDNKYYLDENKRPFNLSSKEIGEGSEYFRSFTPFLQSRKDEDRFGLRSIQDRKWREQKDSLLNKKHK